MELEFFNEDLIDNLYKPGLLITQLPRNAAYQDLIHSLTSGFIPHCPIHVLDVSKTRSYVYRFKHSFDIDLAHGQHQQFKWTIRWVLER